MTSAAINNVMGRKYCKIFVAMSSSDSQKAYLAVRSWRNGTVIERVEGKGYWRAREKGVAAQDVDEETRVASEGRTC